MTINSSDPNPYQPPQADELSITESPIVEEMLVDEHTLAKAAKELASAKVWTGVSGFASFCFVLCLIVQNYFVAQEVGWEEYLFPIVVSVAVGIYYLTFAAQSMNCSSTITSFLEDPTSPKLADCIQSDAKFWKIVGILFIIYFGLAVAVFIILLFLRF